MEAHRRQCRWVDNKQGRRKLEIEADRAGTLVFVVMGVP
jgi:hypothetical protein